MALSWSRSRTSTKKSTLPPTATSTASHFFSAFAPVILRRDKTQPRDALPRGSQLFLPVRRDSHLVSLSSHAAPGCSSCRPRGEDRMPLLVDVVVSSAGDDSLLLSSLVLSRNFFFDASRRSRSIFVSTSAARRHSRGCGKGGRGRPSGAVFLLEERDDANAAVELADPEQG
jgi:hypothetical protein